ncbi:hypothetical protein F4604DRAFT_1677588 [Suillus subluteus]|nr:hypothetical protein F4604DRAFT_1677588 [Suillus subluteus]
MLPIVDGTCRGKTSDSSQCPCLWPKLRKDQKDDEPAICINCGHYDTSHLQEAIPQQPPSTSSSFGSIMSKYSHLLSKTGASEEVARRETNVGFRKQDIALSASTSHTAKVEVQSGSSRDAVKRTAVNLRKTGIGLIVMVTAGLIAPSMTNSDIDKYLRTLFPRLFKFLENHKSSNLTSEDGFYWYLIVKSGKNMVKSSQEGLTGNEVLKTRHPASWKWTDQFIYFGTVLEMDPESFGDSMSEVESIVLDTSEDIGGSNDMEEPPLKGKDFFSRLTL